MADYLQSILQKAFPFLGKSQHRAIMAGLDSSGRTCALYKLKLGEVVSTIPTIGFNVESITYKGADITMWDVGGCDKIRPLWRHYFPGTDIIFWFIDSHDFHRMDTAQHELSLFAAAQELQTAVFVIVCNKIDLPNVSSPQVIAQKLKLQTMFKNHPHKYRVVPTCAISGDGLWEMIDVGLELLKTHKQYQSDHPSEEVAAQSSATVQDEQANLISWLQANDDSDEIFLQKLADYSLSDWSHRTHLRIAWIFLSRYGRRKGMARIFDSIKKFIQHSPRTNGKTFHETLTYFWVHMVHYSMISMKYNQDKEAELSHDLESTLVSADLSSESFPDGLEDFRQFLVFNPVLSSAVLYLDYYTHKLMMQNPEARTSVILPDIKSLPSIIPKSNPTIVIPSSFAAVISSSSASSSSSFHDSSSSSKHALVVKVSKDEDDAEIFLSAFETDRLSHWGHDVLIHIIFAYLTRSSNGASSRKSAVDSIFRGLERYMGIDFHFSSTYMWIQLIDHIRHVVAQQLGLASANLKWSVFKQHPSVHSTVLDSSHWTVYYSESVLYSDEAKHHMVLPDIAPFPSLLASKK